jgi:hypothetical protein
VLPRVTTEETETSEARQQPAQAVFHPPLRNQFAIALLGDVDGVLLAQFGLETGHDEAVGFIDLRLEPVRAIASEVRLSEARLLTIPSAPASLAFAKNSAPPPIT